MHSRRFLLVPLFTALVLGACSAPVVHQLPETEANTIVAVLQSHGIPAGKTLADEETNTWNVSVPKGDTARAWSVLQEYKLPRAAERRFQDVFGQSKLVVTPMEEKALYLEALQGEIASTLESIDGVIDARVHLVLSEKDLIGSKTNQPKASVVVEYQPNTAGAPPIQNVEVQQLVANAVDGLQGGDVVVVLKPSSFASPASGLASNITLVEMAGLTMENSSADKFKIYVVVVAIVLIVLGVLFFLQGRTIQRLQQRVALADRQLRRAESSSGN